jgi:uncharacterized protein
MYNLGDDSYKIQPKFMSEDTVDNVITKTKQYIIENNLEEFNFLFHGGEPLLMNKMKFQNIIVKLKVLEIEIENLKLFFSIQTNGVLLDEEWSQILFRNEFEIGISVDGTKESHDKYRIDHKGNGSYDLVKESIKIVKENTGRADVICVIDVDESPSKLYQSFKDLNVNSVNLLMKDYTYNNFPFVKNEDYKLPYADYLIELFDLWLNDNERYEISMFSGLINIILGFANFDDQNSNELKSLIIETNGGIEPIDSLKACGQEFTKTNLNIKDNDLNDIFKSSLGNLYFNESLKVCSQCENCPIFNICLGGRLVHRFNKENGFDNPSIYCEDLIKFISHIQNKLYDVFPDIDKSTIEKIDYKKIIAFNKKNSYAKANEQLLGYKENLVN